MPYVESPLLFLLARDILKAVDENPQVEMKVPQTLKLGSHHTLSLKRKRRVNKGEELVRGGNMLTSGVASSVEMSTSSSLPMLSSASASSSVSLSLSYSFFLFRFLRLLDFASFHGRNNRIATGQRRPTQSNVIKNSSNLCA